MSEMKHTDNRLRRGLSCLLPVVCALLLLLNLVPSLMKAAETDRYEASGRLADIQPVGFPPSAGLININTATAEELDSLPGIGPAIAQAVIDEREANGPYFYPEDLMDAKGIGESRFAALKDLITTGE